MSGNQSLTPYEPDAYEVIARAMAESERGRWFLDEHARRNRGPDTGTLLDAIARVESAVTAQRLPDDVGQLRGNLLDMANAISRTKAEIAAISPPDQDQSRLGTASEALDAIVRTTERATSDILGAAEQVQEAAWLLRERGIESDFSERLDRHATQIYTACSFQDLTAQRTSRIVHTLRYLEDRLTAMIAIWDVEDGRVPPAPAAKGEPAVDLCQSDVDRFIDAEAPALPVLPLLGATALDDDLAFVESPVEPEAEGAAEAFAAVGMDAGPVAEAEGLVFDSFEPAIEVAGEIEKAETAEAAPQAIETSETETGEIALQAVENPETETGEIDVLAVENPETETGETALHVEDIAVQMETAEIEAAPSLDIEDPIQKLEEPIFEAAEPTDADAFEAGAALAVAESDAATAEAMILPAAPEADADEPAPVQEDAVRTAAPARLDDIDLLSIEEKLALFS